MGLAFGKRELLESWRAYKVRPAANEPVGHRFELGTSQHELLAGFVAAVDYMASLGWDAMLSHERALGERFLAGLPESVELYGIRGMEGRVPTFCFNVPGHSAERVAVFLAEREIAVWHGDYYAVETMKHLGLSDGAVRAGIVHYNTEDEVDRLLDGLAALGVKLLLLGGPRFLGRAIADAALERGHELTFFNRGTTNPELYPEVERIVGDRKEGLDGLARSRMGRGGRHVRLPPARRAGVGRGARGVGRLLLRLEHLRLRGLQHAGDEDSPVAELGDLPDDEVTNESYGALKALCESAVRDVFGERALVVRPGLIVGPHDPTGRFTYWPHRSRARRRGARARRRPSARRR